MSDQACTFCGKPDHEAFVLVAGPTVMICDECIELCRDLLGVHRERVGCKVVTFRDRDGSGEAGQTAKQAGPEGQQPGP